MRFILSCLLLTFLTACQTTQVSPKLAAADSSFPANWSKHTVVSKEGETRRYSCSKESCGEKISVSVTKADIPPTSPATFEETLKLPSVNEQYLKEMFTLLAPKIFDEKTAQIEFTSIRKIPTTPVGFVIEGRISGVNGNVRFVNVSRVKDNQLICAVAMAESAQAARSWSSRINLPSMLD